MKAVVVRQPWASLIAHGIKTIETRPFRPTNTIKPGDRFAIVAGKAKPKEDQRVGPYVCHEYSDGVWRFVEGDEPAPLRRWSMPLGAVVAVVTFDEALRITDEMHCPERHLWLMRPDYPMVCDEFDFVTDDERRMWGVEEEAALGDFTPGRYGWLLSDPHRLPEPVPVKGKQGVFDLPDDVAAAVTAQLP